MKNKILSINIILIFLFTTLISVNAAAPSPRVDLNDYELTVTDVNNVYVNGTVSMAKGQNIALFDSAGKVPLSYTTVKNTGSLSSFKINVPAFALKNGTNTFKVISLPVRGVLNASSPKTVTIKVKTVGSKQDQTITANDISIKVNEKKNINAKVNSGLPLTYWSKNPIIATVDANGTVYGNNVGSTTIEISQGGSIEYNSTIKTIKVTVSDNKPTPVIKKAQTITVNFNKYQFANIDKTKKLTVKSSSGLTPTFKVANKKIVKIDKQGTITSKKPGTTKITITVPGNTNYKPATKTVTIKVPEIKSDQEVAKPIMKACEKQAKWMKNYSYGDWSPCTISHSKKAGTCVTYVACVLQRLGYKDSGGYVWHNGSGFGKGKVRGANSNFNTIYLKNIKVKNAKNKVKAGDIVLFDDNRSGNKGGGGHIFIYTGKYKGNEMQVWDQSSGKSHGCKARYDYANRKILAVVRIKQYKVSTICENGTITNTSNYLIKENATIKYSPSKGKKLKSITVDGKNISVKKYPNSYTFKNLKKNHTIKVVFE